MSICYKNILSLFFLSPLILTTAVYAQSQVLDAQLKIIKGESAFIENEVAKEEDIATRGQKVSTTQARTQMLLNIGSLTRLGPNSVFTVDERCINVTSGRILVNGPGEICFGSVAVSVQGTTYVLDVLNDNQARVSVLDGVVDLLNTQQPTDLAVTLIAGQKAIIYRDGRRDPQEDMSYLDFNVLFTDELLMAFERLPDARKIRRSFQRIFPYERIPYPVSRPSDQRPTSAYRIPDCCSSPASPSHFGSYGIGFD
jgi:hypothetical protein